MFVVQRGVVDVQLFDDDGRLLREVRARARATRSCSSTASTRSRSSRTSRRCRVKQGPFLGDEEDKVVVEAETAS